MAARTPKARKVPNPAKAPKAAEVPAADDGLLVAHLTDGAATGQLTLYVGEKPIVFVAGKARVDAATHAALRELGHIGARTDDDPDVTTEAAGPAPDVSGVVGAAAASSGHQTVYGTLPDYADDSPEALVAFWYRSTHPRWRTLSASERKAKATLIDLVRQYVERQPAPTKAST